MRLIFIYWVTCIFNYSFSQKSTYKIQTIAFYNAENLFDTIDDLNTRDEDYTPTGRLRWQVSDYKKKLNQLASVITDIGFDVTKSQPCIVGLSEVENKRVLTDLINTSPLKEGNYSYIHFDSPDRRGIDVALLYKNKVFTPLHFKKHVLRIYNKKWRIYTRDQLVVKGLLDGDVLYFIINHWPSRRGGSKRSKKNRIQAGLLNRRIIDSIRKSGANAKIISMGDYNDNPEDESIKVAMLTKTDKLINPFLKLRKEGYGTTAYRDRWYVFDQLFFTSNLINNQYNTYTFWKAKIYNKPYLINKKGRYKGYPYRSFSNQKYVGGFSDHFPVLIHLIKKYEQ